MQSNNLSVLWCTNNFNRIYFWILNRLDFLKYICTRENRCYLSLSVSEVSPQSKTWVLTMFKLHTCVYLTRTLLKSSCLALAYLTKEKYYNARWFCRRRCTFTRMLLVLWLVSLHGAVCLVLFLLFWLIDLHESGICTCVRIVMPLGQC